MKFGDRLKKGRTELNLTQEQVARDFFITRQTISSWENEKTYPDIISLIKLSDYYHVSLDTLLKEDTGMREFLEKKDVTRKIKPIYRNLIVIDLLVCSLLLGDFFNLIHLGVFILPIFLLLLCSVSALNKLNAFNNSSSLGLKYTWQKYLSGEKGLKYSLVMPTLFIISGVAFLLLKELYIGGIIIIAGALLIFFIFTQKKD
ncbi:XRE family transcriptional regulator [Levilactobacillus brevis]|uniref:Transcriptional regulator, xre family n=1 Tax=Levilactobacillus brevis (strain ATCC 367 / BCRC 12310 / CIP 105137 / JCM 1170 / LMG 11437 / NCIMB 947 / NCTC 947) TaxID=387344 RepID=Q03N49_LEVBA|nr:helix-turn-helix transcriptional regulator [Levilactobacillus brevis]ABJ65373.1 Transcriptional regulator, xre family [Levilactobacillus brevis ATCC 367]RWZ42868.1 XRE family transcriptional regulator [Levilactobacillus brevis]